MEMKYKLIVLSLDGRKFGCKFVEVRALFENRANTNFV